jgi:hypothetical protein
MLRENTLSLINSWSKPARTAPPDSSAALDTNVLLVIVSEQAANVPTRIAPPWRT